MASPSEHDENDDTPHPLKVRVKLNTVADVQRELAKLYRLARSKQMDTSEASKLANILMMIARIMETSDLEARLSALERGER
jgi:hypothetical protein